MALRVVDGGYCECAGMDWLRDARSDEGDFIRNIEGQVEM
jgi:hypothetical protein